MKIKITKTDNGLDELAKKAKELEGNQEAKLGDLLTPQFISANSSFQNIEELFEASSYKIESREDFEAIPDQEWDDFISNNTELSSWEAMQKEAVVAYTKRQLGL